MPGKFQFPLANLFLMMLPLAVACWGATYAARQDWHGLVVLTLVVGISSAVGALVGGRVGLGVGAVAGLWLIVVAFGFVIIMVYLLWVA